MFNIGPGELMAILAVALIVLGPTRLPEAVRTVGRVVGELRRISSGFQDELRNAFDDSDVIDQLEKGPSARPPAAPGEPIDAASLGLAQPTPAAAAGGGAGDGVDDDDHPVDDHCDDDHPVDDHRDDDHPVDDHPVDDHLVGDVPLDDHRDGDVDVDDHRGDVPVDDVADDGREDPPDTDQRAAS